MSTHSRNIREGDSVEINEEIIDQIREQLNAINAEPFFLCISGSDNYGFSSVNNSDVDIRGAYYFRNPEEMFNLPIERSLTKEGEYMFEGMKYEWQIHEVLKFFRLMGKSNMNIFDWIFSHDWVVPPATFFDISPDELRKNCLTFINQNMINHALGWTKHMFNEDWRIPKKILHSLRPLMTVIHLMESGEYEPNITVLVKQDYLSQYADLVEMLIELKKARRSTNPIIKIQSNNAYDEMEQRIKDNRSKIPEKADVNDRIKAQVTDVRMKSLRHHGHV